MPAIFVSSPFGSVEMFNRMNSAIVYAKSNPSGVDNRPATIEVFGDYLFCFYVSKQGFTKNTALNPGWVWTDNNLVIHERWQVNGLNKRMNDWKRKHREATIGNSRGTHSIGPQ